MTAMHAVDKIVAELEQHRPIAVCAIVATRGSTPQPAGTFVCVDQAGKMTGTLGGGCAEDEIRIKAFELLSAQTLPDSTHSMTSQGKTHPCEIHSIELDHDFGKDDGMICGGRLDVGFMIADPSDDLDTFQKILAALNKGEGASFKLSSRTREVPSVDGSGFEYIVHMEAMPKLVIVGAGHISRILAQMVQPLGFEITVIDDRVSFANSARFPTPIKTLVGDIAKTVNGIEITADTYIVIVTRGHKHDEQALAAVVDSPARYIGMIGSQRKIDVVFDDLHQTGVAPENLARVHAPIGLNIGSVTTEEIALSIAAQLVSVRRSHQTHLAEGTAREARSDA